MVDNAIALQVQPTQFAQNVTAGYNNGMAQKSERMQQEAAALEQLAQIGFGVMDGKLDGPIDPARLEQAVGLLGDSPLAAKVKENPELLRTITKGSLKVLAASRDEQQFEMAKKQFELELANAQKGPAPIELSPGATVYDPASNKAVFTAPTAEQNKPLTINDQLIDPVTGKVKGDYRDAPPPPGAPQVEEVYDPITGRPTKRQWNAQTQKWDDFGGVQAPKEGEAGGTNFDDIAGLRKEIQQLPSYKNLAQATPIYNAMTETAGRDTRASDLNLVYGLGKIMDPTSVVREGEMFMVQGINTLPDKVVEGVNSLLTGTSTLSESTRQAILTEAFGRVKGYEDAFKQDADSYRGIASRYKINPEDILPIFQPASPWSPSGEVTDWTDYFD